MTGCNKGEEPQLRDEKICELHHQQLKSIFGYAPGPGLMVSPGYGVTEFNTLYGNHYPHNNFIFLRSSQGGGYTEETTVEVCEECEKGYSRDFAAYLKIDEKERQDQFMDFIMKNPDNSEYIPEDDDSYSFPMQGLFPNP